MLPSAGDVHINQPLTQISIAYMQSQDMFVAHRVFPIVPVQKQSDRFIKYNREDWFRVEAKKRAPSTESAGAGWTIDNTPTYYCDVLAIHKDVDDQIRANADQPINMDRDATEFVSQQLMLKRELEWANDNFTSGVWGTDLSGVSGSPSAGQFQQWNESGSTPIEDVTGQIVEVARKTGYRPNKFVISPSVFNALKNHPDVIDRIKYTQTGVVTADILAGLFEVNQVLVAWGVQNAANEGATASYDFFLGDHALLVYAAPSPSILQPSGGYTFAWTGFTGAGPMAQRMKRFRMEHLSSDRVEGEMAVDHKLVAADLGVFFENAVA